MSEGALGGPGAGRLYGKKEEFANAATHGLGACLAVWGMIRLILRGAENGSALQIACAALYGGSLILLYGVSCLYHALTNPKAKRVFRVMDHCTIYFLILGTYVPISLAMIGGALGWVLFGINTACAVLGIAFTAADMERWKKLSMILYVAMGWMVVLALGSVIRRLPARGIALLLAGGAAYTGGIWFYKRKGKPWAHLIWHVFVLAGSLFHYFMIYGGYGN